MSVGYPSGEAGMMPLRETVDTKVITLPAFAVSPQDYAILGMCEGLFVHLPRAWYKVQQFVGLVRHETWGLDLVVSNVAPLRLQNYLRKILLLDPARKLGEGIVAYDEIIAFGRKLAHGHIGETCRQRVIVEKPACQSESGAYIYQAIRGGLKVGINDAALAAVADADFADS